MMIGPFPASFSLLQKSWLKIKICDDLICLHQVRHNDCQWTVEVTNFIQKHKRMEKENFFWFHFQESSRTQNSDLTSLYPLSISFSLSPFLCILVINSFCLHISLLFFLALLLYFRNFVSYSDWMSLCLSPFYFILILSFATLVSFKYYLCIKLFYIYSLFT